MKAKEKLLALICLLFCANGVSSQTYYYNETKTFYENGYTYQCDKAEWGLITLYNKNNQYTYADWTYKDGSPLSAEIQLGYVELIEDDTWTKAKFDSIVNNAFSTVEKQRIQEIKVMVCMTINPNTGNVIEVDFTFSYNNGFATIPVSVYRKIEVDIKQYIWFTLTDTGKSLNYVKRGWRHEVK